MHVGFVAVSAAFAALFVVMVLWAFHQPAPHGLPVGVVAPAGVTEKFQNALEAHFPGGFSLSAYPSEASARAGIARHHLDGALVAAPDGLRLLIADAGGAGPAQALTKAFGDAAGQHLTVIDVVPPLSGDSEALSSFFVILGVLVPSLAAGSASALVFRRARRGWSIAAPAIVAMAIGLIAAGIADGLTGFGNYLAIAGIVALFSLAVSAPTAALGRIAPPLTGLAVLVFMVLGIPVSGGPSGLAAFGPGFLRAFGSALPLGVAANTVRNTVYFHGYDTAGHLLVLGSWAAAGAAALALVAILRRQPTAPVTPEAITWPPAALSPIYLVVGFDDSGPAKRALNWAVRLLATRSGTLHVVYADHQVVDSDLAGFGYAEIAEASDKTAADAAAAAAAIAAPAGLAWTFERRQGSPADAILSAATALAAAAPDGTGPVIVVGRPGHATRHLIGSVPVRLLHHSPYPVIAIP